MMCYLSIGHHYFQPSSLPTKKEPSSLQKTITLVAALALGVGIAYLGSLFPWYVGVGLGGVVCTMATCYLILQVMKKNLSPTAPFPFHEKQREGLCGKHAINNAFGYEVEDDKEAFLQKTRAYEEQKIGCMIGGDGTDPGAIQEVLRSGKEKAKTKTSKISDIPGIVSNKERALLRFVGKARWIIIANAGEPKYLEKRKLATGLYCAVSAATKDETLVYISPHREEKFHKIANGHIFAARKDGEGNWWIIDSRNDYQMCTDLSLLDEGMDLIVPVDD